jgi:acyl-coenzyme A synthetase/AMP-(fatty) acid ligase
MAYGMSRKFGSALIRAGATKGDVMGVVLPNIPEFPIGKLNLFYFCN